MNWFVNVFGFQMVKKKSDHCDNDNYDDGHISPPVLSRLRIMSL